MLWVKGETLSLADERSVWKGREQEVEDSVQAIVLGAVSSGEGQACQAWRVSL